MLCRHWKSIEQLTDRLNQTFRDIYAYKGNEKLTDDQLTIIRRVLSGHDTLNILPTGGGKSACYLVPAMLLPGVTLIITPLLSLMRNQIEKPGVRMRAKL